MRRETSGARGGAWRAALMALAMSGMLTLVARTDVSAQDVAVSAADAAAIKEVVAKYVAARELNDTAAVTALFTPDADQLVSSGEWRRGRTALVTGAMASSQRSGGRRTVTIETIRVLAAGVALADGRYEIAASPGNPARLMWSSFVLVRGTGGETGGGAEAGTAGRWRIAAIRNMLPAPPPPAAAEGR